MISDAFTFVTIPQDMVGKVIGARGCNIKRWKNLEGISRLDMKEMTVVIEGDPCSVSSVKEEITHLVSNYTETISIPDALVGRVIGKGGCNVKRWKQYAGVRRVVINKDNKVIISGSILASVHKIQDELHRILEFEVQQIGKKKGFIAEFYAIFIYMEPNEMVTLVSKGHKLNYVEKVDTATLHEHDELADLTDRLLKVTLTKGIYFRSERENMIQHLSEYLTQCGSNNARFTYKAVIGQMSIAFIHGVFSASELFKRGEKRNSFLPVMTKHNHERLRVNLLKNGYRSIRTVTTMVVHVVDVNTAQRKSITFYSDDFDLKAKLKSNKDILQDIFECTEPEDILGVKKNVTKYDIDCAFRERYFQTHPRKNGHPAAALAFKMILSAYEYLCGATETFFLPKEFDVDKVLNTEEEEIPKIKKIREETREGLLTMVHPGNELDIRLKIARKEPVNENYDVYSKQLSEAWLNRSDDGELVVEGSSPLRVTLTRYRKQELFQSDKYYLKLGEVSSEGNKQYITAIKSFGLQQSTKSVQETITEMVSLIEEAERIKKYA
jgi:transcription antitermination factor NusA-like protein